MKQPFNLNQCHTDWHPILNAALSTMDQHYLNQLIQEPNWLPGPDKLLAAFSLPLIQTNYILLGESPYPRASSANGYAFWDNDVGSLWSEKGLSKPVNRATSLRNLIKMLLIARGSLPQEATQNDISKIDKSKLIQTGSELFTGMMRKGILLLNACLVYSEGKIPYHARQWKPFMQSLLQQLAHYRPSIELILLGKIAQTIPQQQLTIALCAEHPYNVSFITNHQVIEFFKPLDLLSHESY